jgi:carbonic anhydrase
VAIISCCDSRVDPGIVFNATPGELFVIRNVANLVPPYERQGQYHGTSAALEFAVRHLKVEHVVVLGHAHCGGIKLLLDSEGDTGESSREDAYFLNNWVAIARPVLQTLPKTEEYQDPSERQHDCEKAALKLSLENLMTFPWIAERVDSGELELHGWYYDLATSTIERVEG